MLCSSFIETINVKWGEHCLEVEIYKYVSYNLT